MRLWSSLLSVLVVTSFVSAQGTPADYERSARLFALTRDKVFRTAVEPHWFAGGTRFWYRVDLPDRAREFVLVDAEAGKREPAFDHANLAAALAKAAGKDVSAARLPFDTIEVEGATIRFSAFGQVWAFDRASGAVAAGPAGPRRERGPTPREVRNRPRGPRGPNPWTVTTRENNIVLKKAGEPEFQLTRDGTAEDSYSGRDLSWSPDFAKLVALRTRKAEPRVVTLVESSPRDQLQPRVVTYQYPKPGDKLPVAKPHLFDVTTRKEIPVPDELFPNPWELQVPHWQPDGSAFRFVYNQRGHQVLRVIEVDAATGKPRALVNEESKTFIDYAHKQFLHEVDSTNELIWMSERDGWNHLYLIDGKTGTVKNPITTGAWVVRGVDRVEEEKRQVWFRAGGIHTEQDPYYLHYCRINFDGTGLVKLTDGDGTHSIRYSPDGKYLLDSYSRVDLAPVTELRRADDGKLVCVLERGDMSALVRAGWQVPERFAAKGRDGTTDIYGIIFRPTNFDPNKKYSVIEQIYAGPQGSFVPKTFAPFYRLQELAELGFVVVQMDGMGTSNRSKTFHDVCCKNLGDAGFPDRILWMKAAAAKYPQLDLSRVGVYGGSAGGQNALGAVLTHGDFYKAAAADCGCHDNRMDKVWWNELWMGYPVGPHYAEQSNVTQAHRLTGKLLLAVGEMDRNVDPASTMQVVNALIKAGKDFELVVVPGGGHGAGGMPYGDRRRKDFFVKNLLDVQPPDRNKPPAPKIEAKADPKKDPPKADAKTAPSAPAPKAEPKKAAPAEIPDLAALVAKSASEVRPLVRMYEADQGALRRNYAMPTTEADCSRLRKFYSDWTTAVDKIDVSSLSNTGVDDLSELRKRVEKDRKELEDVYLKTAEVAPLLPFAPKIVALELARRKLEPFDPIKVAGGLAELQKDIDRARQAVADPKGHDLPDVYVSKPALARAIEVVGELRGVFKSWHDFYAGYDPMFTWWTAQPAKDVDAALDRLAKLLKDKVASAPAHTGPLRMVPRWEDGPSDIPDPRALIGKPSEMAGVIQRYQADIQGRGRFPGFADLSAADRRERQLKQAEGWLAALEKIDFDTLSYTAQVDYLLVRNGLRRNVDQLRQPAADGGGRPRRARDDNEIVGRPIGREALLAALAAEMVPYSPEQLVEMANREYVWCEAEMKKAAREMGLGDDWKAAVEKVKTLHVEPGGQPKLVRDLALEAIDYLRATDLVTVPPLAAETWRMDMMSPERQRFNPFFTGGEVISVAFPTDTMSHEQKLQALRGNNIHFSRATVHHELIPGHHLQQFMTQRYQPQRQPFGTPFWTEGWAVYWEMVLYEKGFPRGPEDRVGLMFWRMHRCARVIFSLGFHLGKMTPQECIDFLVDKVGHERENATAEVRRSFQGSYPPLYQAGYLVGAKQFWALRQELVTSGKLTEKAFHDAILKEGILPVELVRAAITNQKMSRDFKSSWKFLGDLPGAKGDRVGRFASVETLLRRADSVELLSLEPKPEKDGGFHGWKVLGKTEVAKDHRDKAIKEVVNAMEESDVGDLANCFRPRHGIRAKIDNTTVEMVICFECHRVVLYRNEDKREEPIKDAPQKYLDELLTAAKVPLAPKPGKEK